MKKFTVFTSVFLTLIITFSSLSSLTATAENISDKVLRLHIIANSNSSKDQNIKLGLKDYFLKNTADIFNGKTIDESIIIAKENTELISSICNDYLQKYNQRASVKVDYEFFPTRVYDDYTLPAGYYNSIKITIGEGSGHNWWCIVFPSVCLSSCSESMSEYLSDDEMELINSGYSPKFKIIEIYEKIKDRLNK